MKTTQRRLRSSSCILSGLLFGALVAGGADGGVDPGFNPPEVARRIQYWLAVVGRQLYFEDDVGRVRGLREDGSLDSEWRLNSPVGPPVRALVPLASGGWVVGGTGRSFLEPADGAVIGIPQDLLSFTRRQFFPQEDGSVVINGLNQVAGDGSAVGAFRQVRSVVAAGFEDPPRIRLGGQADVVAMQDRQGRFIVAGNFLRAGGRDRLGLVRYLPQGAVDPNWDPAPNLGIVLGASNTLNILPYQVSPGPDDSVLVGLMIANPGGPETLRLATVSADGTVTANFANHAIFGDAPPIVQPDGRILVGGRFDHWGATPATGLVRLLPGGSVDPSFQVTLSGSPALVSSMAADDAGRLWFSGQFGSVNGVELRGLARVFAWTPLPAGPSLVAASSPERVAAGEMLFLGARVSGVPEAEFQWYRNGELIAGATNRGLRLPVDAGTPLGTFRLVARNASGTQELEFSSVALAKRSARPGGFDPAFNRALTNFDGVTQLAPLADGKILVAAGRWDPLGQRGPRVGRLLPGGELDSTFGEQGLVTGRGIVEALLPLEDGGILVVGELTELDGQAVFGIGQLDRKGRVVQRPFPELDVPHVSAVQPLPDGGMLVAGRFSAVAGKPAHRLARLGADLLPDLSFHSPLEPWQFVDAMTLDSGGRLLIAGERIYTDVVLTNPPPVGLQRLRLDGSPDPQFRPFPGAVRSVFVEPEGTLLIGMPARRVNPDGELLVEFLSSGIPRTSLFPSPFRGPAFQPDHRMVRLPDGGVAFPVDQMSGPPLLQLVRWSPDGLWDFNFSSILGTTRFGPSVQAAALLPDGSLVAATQSSEFVANPPHWEASHQLIRILPDPDSSPVNPRLDGGSFTVDVATQPGASYELRGRPRLDTGVAARVDRFQGDGYVRPVSVPAEGDSAFLELERR